MRAGEQRVAAVTCLDIDGALDNRQDKFFLCYVVRLCLVASPFEIDQFHDLQNMYAVPLIINKRMHF